MNATGLCPILLISVATVAFAIEVPEYEAIRAARPDGRTVPANGLTLTRDVYQLTFRSGTFHFLAPVGGRTFGAVFIGDGNYELDPATANERRHLALVTGEKELQKLTDGFTTMVLLFADRTASEIEQHGAVTTAAPNARAKEVYEEHLREQKIKYEINLHLRILQDLLNGTLESNGVFLAVVDGKRFDPALIAIDPLGIGNLAARFGYYGGEETALLSFDNQNGGFWYLSTTRPGAVGGRGKPLKLMADALHYIIDTKINSRLEIEATTTIRLKPTRANLRVLPIHILPKLRLHEASVGAELVGIVQEEIELRGLARLFREEVADADAALVFSKPLPTDEEIEIRISYGGRDVLQSVGSDSYSVRARESWYPNIGTFTDSATYELTFRFPRRNDLVSVGELVSEKEEAGERIALWKSDQPLRIAGFNYGRFEKRSRKEEISGVQVSVFAARDRTKMIDDTLVDAMNTARIGSVFFGKPPYSPISVTQQAEWNFGQSWPSLIYLPTLALTTSTERVEIFEEAGPRLFEIHEFAKMVGWHEVAHQWWGHLVGWESYRDQWLSEGFSEFTAALVLQFTESLRKYADYWKRRRDDILARRTGAIANSDAGAISQGFRLSTRRTPQAAQAAVYAKGGFVLHMLRMMMRDPMAKEPDEKFIAMMRDFVSSYAGKNPSTADFQKVVERHMNPRMDAAGNGKMDYFFNQWIHGTEIPRLSSELSARDGGGGKYRISGSVSQQGVSQEFRTIVPVYVDFGKDQVARIGAVRLVGTKSESIDVELALPRPPKRILINAMQDVLSRE